MSTLEVGFLVFPQVTQLDLAGPFEVFARTPDTTVHLIGRSLNPVESAPGHLRLQPTISMQSAPQLDVLCVPGGAGIAALMEDDEALEFLRRQAQQARYVTAVCTGALVLGAAGLLEGYRATTHWLSLELLPLFGAIPTEGRVVFDRNRVTGGGVTAGIDFGLALAAQIFGQETAEDVQLMMEYAPDPPFRSGSPEQAGSARTARLKDAASARQNERREIAVRAARALRLTAPSMTQKF